MLKTKKFNLDFVSVPKHFSAGTLAAHACSMQRPQTFVHTVWSARFSFFFYQSSEGPWRLPRLRQRKENKFKLSYILFNI